MTGPDIRKIQAVCNLIKVAEALVASGALGEAVEAKLRRHIVDACNAFDIPTVAERDPSSDLVIVGDHTPEIYRGKAA